MNQFPSLKWPQLRRILQRPPLSYRATRTSGSHTKYESDAGYPPLYIAFHQGVTIAPGLVRDILVNQVGLSEQVALSLV